mmetsp:Transcript_33220/g.71795  ORF Transcript_33220/g.71795 Transcript_33220/m.71795 type:complete len:82 (-) Transcript_33220:204-449(-)
MIRKKITFAHACTTTVTDFDAIGHTIEFESLEGDELLWIFHTFRIKCDVIIKKREREREKHDEKCCCVKHVFHDQRTYCHV